MESMNSFKPATSGQIGRLEEMYGDGLKSLPLDGTAVEGVIEDPILGPALVKELAGVTRKYVEARGGMIVRRVRVDRKLTPQQMLDATGRKQYTDKTVVDNMPRGEGDEVDFYFFKASRQLTDAELEEELRLHGLRSDPMAQCRVNTDDPAFADEHANGCHWQDADGNWCYAAFYRWGGGERNVSVRRYSYDWDGDWWFGGVR